MQFLRVGIAVLIAFMLGIGVGLVGGIYVSVHEFAAPVKTVVADKAGTSAPSNPSLEASPSPTASASASPQASPTPSTAPSPKEVAATPDGASKSPEAASKEPDASASPQEASGASPDPKPEASPSASPTEEPTPEPPKKATLRISANKGKGFKVFVDGEAKGVTPMAVEVAPGQPHTVKVVGGDKFKSWTGKASAKAGEIEDVEAELSFIEPPPAAAAPAPIYHAPAYHAPAYHPRPAYNPAPRYSAPSGGAPSITGTHKM